MPWALAEFPGKCGIFTSDGNSWTLSLTGRRGVESTGHTLRIGLVQCNKAEEVDRRLAPRMDLPQLLLQLRELGPAELPELGR